MDGMKKLISVTIAFIVAAGIFALVLNVTKNDLKKQIEENSGAKQSSAAEKSIPEIDQDVLFFSYFQNLSYNADVKGYLIDNHGQKLDYVLTGNTKVLTAEEAFKKALSQKDKLKGTDFISGTDLSNLHEVVYLIDTKQEFFKEEIDEKNGTTTLYAVIYENNKPKLVKIYSTGDVVENPKDGNAVVVRKYFQKKLSQDE